MVRKTAYVWVVVSSLLLLGGSARSDEPASLQVRVIEETHSGGAYCARGLKWHREPLRARTVHVRSKAWEGRATTDSTGLATFEIVPIGEVVVWCDTTFRAGRMLTLLGGRVATRAGVTIDTLTILNDPKDPYVFLRLYR